MSDFPFDKDAAPIDEGDLPDDVRIISIGAQAQFQVKVSGVDYDALIQNRWTFTRSSLRGRSIYARRHIRRAGSRITLLMHRFILETLMGLAPPSENHTGDHINGDTLDNRRENLRWLTPSQQRKNQRPRR